MGNPLHERCTVAELAATRQTIEIADKISSFEILAGIVEADLAALDADKVPAGWRDNSVFGALEFGFADADARFPKVSGNATAAIGAVCQRCLEPFELQLTVEPNLLVLETDEVADGYDDYEVWELEERTVRPRDIVEELLIMAMPLSAVHDKMAECKAFLSDDASDGESDDESDDEGVEELVKPFAALRAQMTQNENDPED